MLTFFKPWRTGLDLKNEDTSWDAEYNMFDFTDRQEELMRNFNVRYECYDARDDFSASRERDPDDDNDDSSNDSGDDVDCDFEGNEHDDLEINELGPEGKAHQLMRSLGIETVNVLRKAGWQNDGGISNALRAALNLPNIVVDSKMRALHWNSIINSQKQLLWRRRFEAATTSEKNAPTGTSSLSVRNDAYVVPSTFLSKDFIPTQVEWVQVMDKVITLFSLNNEQAKVFCIIANHASSIAPDQLLMYMGGMGGTGKSTVIRALEAFFNERKEPYCFALLAPTGTAAALIGGTTYHSFLGFRAAGAASASIAEVIERLRFVNYILLDEVSMLGCLDMCRISARCCEALGVYEKPFGGLNVIFAGDFAQLPPARERPLYSRTVPLKQSAKQTLMQQERTIGKSIWLQFTCVVILKENMRQVDQRPAEQAFRLALANLRYSACTPTDIGIFKSWIRSHANGLSIDSPNFKNVSITTARNQEKDQFNEANSIRFAKEAGEQLSHFYSIDELSNTEPKRRKGSEKYKVFLKPKVLTHTLKEDLWDQPPFTGEHIPARLSLCRGLPVLIRNNNATDLCITRGQEAQVVGWTSRRMQSGRHCLEVIYVELIKPPHDVFVPNLPRNVVPLTRLSETVEARLSTDEYCTYAYRVCKYPYCRTLP
jgi:hypothetical protein